MPLQTLRGQYASFLNPGQKQALSTCVTYKSWTLGLDWLNEDESPQTQDQEPNRFEAKNNTAKVKANAQGSNPQKKNQGKVE